MQEEYHNFHTQHLDRELEMLVFGHWGYPVVLFPPAKGRYYDAKDWGLIHSAANLLNDGYVKIYTPDTVDGDSWYNFDVSPAKRVKKHLAYEQTILKDVIDYAAYESESDKVALVGCNLGAYHAANIAFKYPDKVSHLICLGGIFDIRKFITGHGDLESYFNNPIEYMPNLQDEWYLKNIKDIEIVLGTGVDDDYFDESRNLSDILYSVGIEHWFDARLGEWHNWEGWGKMLPDYLQTIKDYHQYKIATNQ